MNIVDSTSTDSNIVVNVIPLVKFISINLPKVLDSNTSRRFSHLAACDYINTSNARFKRDMSGYGLPHRLEL